MRIQPPHLHARERLMQSAVTWLLVLLVAHMAWVARQAAEQEHGAAVAQGQRE